MVRLLLDDASNDIEVVGVGVGGGVMVAVWDASSDNVIHVNELVGDGVGGGVMVFVVVALVVDIPLSEAVPELDAVTSALLECVLEGVGGGVMVDVMDTLTDSVPVTLTSLDLVPTVCVDSGEGDRLADID